MDIKLVKELITLLEESSLSKLEIKDKDFEIKLKKQGLEVVSAPVAQPIVQVSDTKIETSNVKTINSPIVGTFYTKPSPEANEYVSVNSRVKKGDVICIIEAMKVMNEIKADRDGTIKEILVDDSQIVEYDQPLFVIE